THDARRYLHPFPTRRSSDLERVAQLEDRGPGAAVLLGEAADLGGHRDQPVGVFGGARLVGPEARQLGEQALALARPLLVAPRLELLEIVVRLLEARDGLAQLGLGVQWQLRC